MSVFCVFPEPEYGASVEEQQGACTARTLAIAVVMSIIVSLLVGFIVGFFVRHRFLAKEKSADKNNQYVDTTPTKASNPYEIEPHHTNPYVTQPPFPEKGVKIFHNPTKDTNTAKVRNTNLSGSVEAIVDEPHQENSKKVYV